MHIIAILKVVAPWLFFAFGLVLFLRALTGRVQFTLALIVLLAPLRNVVDRLKDFPLGGQFMDLLILASILGWFFAALAQRQKIFTPSPVNGAVIFLMLYTLFSLLMGSFYLGEGGIFSPSEPRVQDWKNFCLLPILYFLILNNIQDKKWVWRIFAVICFSMIIMDYYTVTQICWFSSLESRNKLNGTFQFLGPNEVAAFYDQYTMLLLGVYLFMKRSWLKVGVLSLILVNLYCMIFMYSRAAYIAVAVGMFFIFLHKGRKWLIPLLLVVIFWQVALPQKARDRILSTRNEFGELETSAETRIVVWQKAWDVFKDNSLVGVGYGVFRYLGFELGDTHNIYFKILVEQGLCGIAIFILILLAFLREGQRLYQKGEDDISRGLGLGFMACIVVLLINNIFGDRWSYFELSAYLWICAGLVSRLSRIPRGAVAEAVLPKRKPPRGYYKGAQ